MRAICCSKGRLIFCFHDGGNSCVNVKMAEVHNILQTSLPKKSTDDCENANTILTVVVKRRQAVPGKCMDIDKRIFAFELQRLENAEVITEDYSEKEKFRKVIQRFKRLKSFQLSLDDLHEAERKLEYSYRRTKEINTYLQKRKAN